MRERLTAGRLGRLTAASATAAVVALALSLYAQADLDESVGNTATVITVTSPTTASAANPTAAGGGGASCGANPSPTPPVPQGGLSTNALKKAEQNQGLIGEDNRTVVSLNNASVFPLSAVVHINSSVNDCTGIMYAPGMVLTAGHCLFEHDFGSVKGNRVWATSVVVSPARTGSRCPYGQCKGVKLFSTRGWVEHANEEFDYGVIKLDCTVGDKTGWFGYDWDGLAPTSVVRLAGYRNFSSLWIEAKPVIQEMATPLAVIDQRLLFYAHDTLQGDSGGPLFTSDFIVRAIHGASCHKTAADVHVPDPQDARECWTEGSIHARLNHGVRITERVAANLRAWQQAP